MTKIPSDMVPGTLHKTKFNGKLEILAYKGWQDITVRFLDTGYVRSGCSSKHIRLGNVKDPMRPTVLGVGYIGVGIFSSGTSKCMTSEYEAWRGMLRRCYDLKHHKTHPTYKDCTVCSEWHNFQNFAEWFVPRYKEGFELDKDGLVKGNKIYSPTRCQVISKSENIRLARSSNKDK